MALLGDAQLVVAGPGPDPVEHGEGAGDPSVQSLHSARMAASLVGSKLTMIGLIFRPWIPPASLISLTKSLMALVCSLYSTSPAKPSWPARELRDTTGNTTLMLSLVTPRDEVLAWLGGVGPVPVDPTVDWLPPWAA